MCYGYNTAKVEKIIKTQLPAAGGDLNGFERPMAPIISMTDRKVSVAQWWLIPSWYAVEEYPVNLLNARSETVFEKPAFKDLIFTNRCLVPASHYYEHQWRDAKGKVKVKHRLGVKDTEAFFMGGLVSYWKNAISKEIIPSFSILTTEANELAAEIHNTKKRMPLILTMDDARMWLKPNLVEEQIRTLMKPFDSSCMVAEALDEPLTLF